MLYRGQRLQLIQLSGYKNKIIRQNGHAGWIEIVDKMIGICMPIVIIYESILLHIFFLSSNPTEKAINIVTLFASVPRLGRIIQNQCKSIL